MIDKRCVENVFKEELASFETKGTGIREFTLEVLSRLPEYFYRNAPNGEPGTIILLTRSSLTYANALFRLEQFRDRFQMSERDCIRSALLLCDGFVFGTVEGNTQVFDHPEIMASFIREDGWDAYLPKFVRNDIADIIQTHSGQWNVHGSIKLKKPQTDMEQFAHMCTYMAGRNECTLKLPITASRYKAHMSKLQQSKNITCPFDYEMALKIVNGMVSGKSWDGIVYRDQQTGEFFVFVDQQRITVVPELHQAFLTLGQSRIAQHNGNMVQR